MTDVRQFDDTGIVLTEDRFGSEITRLHDTVPPSRGHEARAWIKHNVEEVGNLESFLPQLHTAETATATVAET